MRHYVLIRSSYHGPEESRARLNLSLATIIPSLRAQTDRRFELIVRIDPRDPLRSERIAAFDSCGVKATYITGMSGRVTEQDRSNLDGSWSLAIGNRNDVILQTRVDDDDALATTFMERMHKSKIIGQGRRVLTFPYGYVLAGGKTDLRYYPGNQFITLQTMPGDVATVYDGTHNEVAAREIRAIVDKQPAWLWVRHAEAISVKRGKIYVTSHPLSSKVTSLFDVDWATIGKL